MHTKIHDWNNGWYGIELLLDLDEIDSLISKLRMLKDEPGQHFHLSSNYGGNGGVGDIEISIQSADVASNMMCMSKAVGPGDLLTEGCSES